MRRLAQVGSGTTGWRSDLETHGTKQSTGIFLVGLLVALAVLAGLVLLVVVLT